MSGTTTITPEERENWRALVMPYPDGTIGNQDKRMLRLLDALEQAEARANFANNVLQAASDCIVSGDPTSDVGLFLECDEFDKKLLVDIAALRTRAEKAEAENARLRAELTTVYADGNNRVDELTKDKARLTKMVDWLADKLGTLHPDCPLKYLKQRPLGWKCHEGDQGPCAKSQAAGCWKEAVSRAVADSEVKG